MQPVLLEGPQAFDAQSWSAVGSIVLGLGAVFGGFWALYNYRRTRRYEAPRWLSVPLPMSRRPDIYPPKQLSRASIGRVE